MGGGDNKQEKMNKTVHYITLWGLLKDRISPEFHRSQGKFLCLNKHTKVTNLFKPSVLLFDVYY